MGLFSVGEGLESSEDGSFCVSCAELACVGLGLFEGLGASVGESLGSLLVADALSSFESEVAGGLAADVGELFPAVEGELLSAELLSVLLSSAGDDG